jgi:hypothetical protein
MPFSTSELARIKHELGYNLLETGASAYVGITALFETVVQNYIAAEIVSSSSTAVSAASSYTPAAVTIASPTGFAAYQRVHVDVDSRAEVATVQSISGSVLTLQLKLAHSGTYPVAVEGPITIARECLRNIEAVKGEMRSSFGYGALKTVDEIEFYQQGKRSHFGSLGEQLAYWRTELASVLGVPNAWAKRSGCGSSFSVY